MTPLTITVTPGVIDAVARVCYEDALRSIAPRAASWDALSEEDREPHRARIRGLLDRALEAAR